MRAKRPRILIIGAGPAGLSAGVHLLEAAGDSIDVEIIAMGHHLGGKAASWRDPQGYSIDHGFHAVFGFYEEMKALARRAGIDLGKALVSSHGEFRYYDARFGTEETFTFAHNPLVMLSRYYNFPGLTQAERDALVAASGRMAQTIAGLASLEQLDDVCYRAFLTQHGVPSSVLSHPMLREVYELAFNAPHEISTYIVLHWARLAGRSYYDASYDYFAGGPSELFWDPISKYFERLGGKLRVREKLIGLRHEGGKLLALQFGIPDNPRFHQDGKRPWPVVVPVMEGARYEETDFAAVVCALPAACFLEAQPRGLALGGPVLRPPAKPDQREQPVPADVDARVVHARRAWRDRHLAAAARLRHRLQAAGAGVPARRPLRRGAGVGRRRRRLRDDERRRAIRSGRASLSRTPGFEGVESSEVVHVSLRRNRGNHQRYLLTDPGTLKFRPTVKTPLQGLFLAGDWVRNEIDIPSMEGAIRCGKAAAHQVLGHLS